MKAHTYLRAYLAGIATPTVFLLVVMTGYCVLRYVYDFPVPVERVIVFPMAVVPNLWGLWNVLYIAAGSRYPMSIGLHGALLPILLAPLGIFFASLLDFHVLFQNAGIGAHDLASWIALLIAAPVVGLSLYYFAWKYLVAFLNRVVGLA
jgi:hypothetical protein